MIAVTIMSKWDGQCKRCGKPYAKGALVRWIKGFGCLHPRCSSSAFEAGIAYNVANHKRTVFGKKQSEEATRIIDDWCMRKGMSKS